MTEHQKTRAAAFTTNFKSLKEFCKANLAQEVEPYPCKFDYQCKKEGKFNAARYRCNHGGGVGCHTWRLKTNREISLRTLPGDA